MRRWWYDDVPCGGQETKKNVLKDDNDVCLQRFRGLYDSSSNSGFESSSDLRDILIAAVDFSIHKVCISEYFDGVTNLFIELMFIDILMTQLFIFP